MEFNEKQTKEIHEFIMKYNTEEEFKNNIEQLYDHNLYRLSILYIYALEEVLRYGTKNIFHLFIEIKEACSNNQAVDLYDEFIHLFCNDINFRQYKMQQLKDSPETLSQLEMFAFTLISSSDDQKEQIHEEMTDELEYDPYNPVLYSTDSQIRETLQNLFFGEFIYDILELPSMRPIKVRQKEKGRIANIDKPFIIEKIQNVVFQEDFLSKLKQIVDNRFVKVKMDILLGKGEKAFEQYLKFNTNISSNEILESDKNYSEEDIYNFFEDIIKKRKEPENKLKK